MNLRVVLVVALALVSGQMAFAQTIHFLPAKYGPSESVSEGALISRLRDDASEKNRLEAAITLGKGNCCTKNTLAALLFTAAGSGVDGGDVETSAKVKSAATTALQVCLWRLASRDPRSPQDTSTISMKSKNMESYYSQQLAQRTETEVIDEASRFLAERLSAVTDARSAEDSKTMPQRQGTGQNQGAEVPANRGVPQPRPVMLRGLPALFGPGR